MDSITLCFIMFDSVGSTEQHCITFDLGVLSTWAVTNLNVFGEIKTLPSHSVMMSGWKVEVKMHFIF